MEVTLNTTSLSLNTSNQDIFTSPANFRCHVKSILVANTTSGELTISLDWYDSSETSYHTLCESMSVPANGVVQITDAIYLQPSDKIRGLASSASGIEVTVLTEQTYALSAGG